MARMGDSNRRERRKRRGERFGGTVRITLSFMCKGVKKRKIKGLWRKFEGRKCEIRTERMVAAPRRQLKGAGAMCGAERQQSHALGRVAGGRWMVASHAQWS